MHHTEAAAPAAKPLVGVSVIPVKSNSGLKLPSSAKRQQHSGTNLQLMQAAMALKALTMESH